MAENESIVSFEIKNHLAVLRENSNGWKKEVNIVSWNGGPARFDIREWSPDHTRMSRGVTLGMDEGRKIVEVINQYLDKNQEHETKMPKERDYER